MIIKEGFNPDLILRKYKTPGKLEEECFPKRLKTKRAYNFRAEGQQTYWLKGGICLLMTDGDKNLSRPLAKITILEYKHFRDEDSKIWTKGVYVVNKIFNRK